MAFKGKRLIFVMSTGRCGTLYLSKVMGTIPGVVAFHEPEPDFVRVMRPAQHYPQLFYQFWIEHKLPHIYNTPGDVYLETSHLFIKGFALPLLHLGIVPDIIVLRRPRREVALSIWRGGAIPGRNFMAQRYWLQPDDYVLTPFVRGPHWHAFTDYQLCYWYTIEIERRIAAYLPKFAAAGSRIYETTLMQMTDDILFRRLVDKMKLPQPMDEPYEIERALRYNASSHDSMPMTNLDLAEQEIEKCIGDISDIAWANAVFGGWWDD